MELPLLRFSLALFLFLPPLVIATPTENEDFKRLKGKWIVRSVAHDGDKNQAQVGQKVGDIISIELNNNQIYLR